METPVTLDAQELKALIKENVREAVTEHLAEISATMAGAISKIEKRESIQTFDKAPLYRQYIKALLSKRAAIESGSSEVESQLIFDDDNDHYQILRMGWQGSRNGKPPPRKERIYYCSVHVNIRDGKIWVQHDGSEIAIADQLAELGVPKQDIVLAYQAPHVRQYTDFAIG